MVKLLKLIISKISTFVKDEWNFYGSFFIAYALSLFLDWNMSKLQRANQFVALLMNIFILLTVIKKIVFPSKKKMKVEKIADMNKQAKNMDLGINPEMKINETVELAEHIMKGGKKIMKKLKDFFKVLWGNKVTLSSTIITLYMATMVQVATYTDKLYNVAWFSKHAIVVKILSPIITSLCVFISLYGTYTKYGFEGLQALSDKKLSKLSKEEKKELKDNISKLEKALDLATAKYDEAKEIVNNFALLKDTGYTLNSDETLKYNTANSSLTMLENTIAKLESELKETKDKL
jgi:hypothetical protein|nr:MAG TPA: hypothetical protein [Caudoviricetes sp.]